MFKNKKQELLKEILDSAEKGRTAFAEQAEKDRTIIIESMNTMKSDANTLIETMNKDREMFAEQAEKDRTIIMESMKTMKSDANTLIETMNKDREMFAEQAEKDRQIIIEKLDSIINENSKDEVIISKEKAAYALNLCTVSVSQIIDYNDLVIMDQEYDNILNNLNLQNFPKDEALLKILKQILDVISFFRIQDGDKKLLEEQYKKKVKNAIWSAVPSPSVILAGGKAGGLGLAVSAITAVGTGYMNYRKERAKVDDEKRQKDWELQKAALEQLHALRRELFDTAWRLADAYNFEDKYRLTACQITKYNKILTEEDPEKRYERLEYLKDEFIAYPPFWYYLGHAAAEVYHNDKYSKDVREKFRANAKNAFVLFLKITNADKYNALLREDQLCAACALELFALIASDDEFEKNAFEIGEGDEEKRKIEYSPKNLLEIASKNSGNAFDTLQICASYYLKIGEYAEAIKLLRMLVNENYNLEMNVQLLSILYVQFSKKIEKIDCETDYNTLSKRGNCKMYMFPWINNIEDDFVREQKTKQFYEEQNHYIFQLYKEIISGYINKSEKILNEIWDSPGTITKQLLEFLLETKNDFTTLFDDELAEDICEVIGEQLYNCKDVFSNANERKNKKANIYNEKSKELTLVTNRMQRQVFDIRNHEDNEKFNEKIAEYLSNIMLFKAQAKINGGYKIELQAKNNDDDNHISIFEKFVKESKKNEADSALVDVVKKFHNDGKLILGEKANFIVDNFDCSKHIRHRSSVKRNKHGCIIAYLDAHRSGKDLLFTDKGMCVPSKEILLTNYNDVRLVDNKEFHIGDEIFTHKDVDMKELEKMINELAEKVHASENNKSIKFEPEYPALEKDEITLLYEEVLSDRLILAEFAIIKYLAVCDGNVSDEEREVLNEMRHSHFDDVSEKIKQELKDIESNELFDFECLNKYLEKLTSEEIKEFIPLMNELLTSSGDINLQEIIAMKNILSYLKNREK